MPVSSLRVQAKPVLPARPTAQSRGGSGRTVRQAVSTGASRTRSQEEPQPLTRAAAGAQPSCAQSAPGPRRCGSRLFMGSACQAAAELFLDTDAVIQRFGCPSFCHLKL